MQPFTVDEYKLRVLVQGEESPGWFWRAAFVETMLSALLVTLSVQIWKRNGAKSFLTNSIMTGIAYFATSYCAMGISGGCLNPMIGLV